MGAGKLKETGLLRLTVREQILARTCWEDAVAPQPGTPALSLPVLARPARSHRRRRQRPHARGEGSGKKFYGHFLRKCSFTPRSPGSGPTWLVGTGTGNTRPPGRLRTRCGGAGPQIERGSRATFGAPLTTRCLSRRKAASSDFSQKGAVTLWLTAQGTGDGPGPASGPPQREDCGSGWLSPFIMTLLPLILSLASSPPQPGALSPSTP